MSPSTKEHLSFYKESIANTYAQMFFSDNRWFALLLFLATFVDPFTGISGLAATLVTLIFVDWFGFNKAIAKTGSYSYNSLMTGLVMGVYYRFNPEYFLFLVLISLFTLFLSVWFYAIAFRHRIPFLSLPFLIGVWVMLLSARTYAAIGLNERGIYTINELWSYGGMTLVHFYEAINSLQVPLFVDVYLKSLGAIYFQYNIFAGILIALGLLIYSRIAFSLSIIGFVTGYLFYYFLKGNFSELQYSYIGFNFILSSIALGGFFLIPSRKSYFLAIVSTPLIGILVSALATVLGIYQLPLYSLPFSLIVVLIMLVLNLRHHPRNLDLVQEQKFSPEKNLYKFLNRKERFSNDTFFHIQLPFFGEWFVSQGHDGSITHKGDWGKALDFVVADDLQKTFRQPGKNVEDFYCYNLPILAPAPGYVIQVLDEVEDNAIGAVDIQHNWGNTIVIKHGEFLFSKISHIKKGSFRVKAGDYVSKGDMLASCGSSGRSPEPHIHFQLQSTPFIGSKTLAYPISYYISKQNGKHRFHAFDYPKEGQTVSRVATTKLLRDAFHFIPGEELNFMVKNSGGSSEQVKWDVYVNEYNHAYLYCSKTGSSAYFVNNDTLHYFTDFFGDKNSLLYSFYLGAHKVLMGYYQDIELSDHLPIDEFYTGPLKFIQDFIAPFHMFLSAEFTSCYSEIDDAMNPSKIKLQSEATARTGTMIRRKVNFEFLISENKIKSFSAVENGKQTMAECTD